MNWIKLEDATALMFPDGATRVSTPEEYQGWQAAMLQGRGIARRWDSDLRPRAHVNHGRWIVLCACGVGAFTHPGWRIACCGECGAVFRGVEFPENWREIEETLLKRPSRSKQNWDGEPLLALKAENLVHGIWQ
jgi:hypothetical protein